MNGNQTGGNIIWNLDVDSAKFNAALSKARADAANFGEDVDKKFTSLQGKISTAFENAAHGSQIFAAGLGVVSGALIAGAGFGVKYAADLETITQGFVTLLGSTEKANAAIAQIQKDAATTPFEFKGLANANQLLTSVTKNSQDSERILLNVGKALTAMGKGQPELDRIIVNLQQIGAVGHASAIDIKQFAFAGIPIYDMLNESIKGTGKSLDDMIANGEVTFPLLTKLFEQTGEGAGRFAKAFETQGGTFNQVFSNFKDNLGITASQLVKQTGLFDLLKDALTKVTAAIGFLASPQGMEQLFKLFDQIKQNAPIVIGFVAGGLAPAFYTLAGGIWAALSPLLPFIAAGVVLGAAVQLIVNSLGGWEAVMGKIQNALKLAGDAYNKYLKPAIDTLIKEVTNNLLPALKDLWSQLQPILIPALKILAVVLGGAIFIAILGFIQVLRGIVFVVTTVVKNITGFISFLTGLPAQIGKFADGVRTTITNAFNSVVTFITNLPQIIATFVTNMITKFAEFLGFIVGLFVYGIPAAIKATIDFFVALPGKIWDALVNLFNTVVTGWTNIWNWIKDTVPKIINSVVDFFSKLPERISTWLQTTKTSVSEGFTNMWNAIVAEVSTWPQRLFDWGANIANSFVEGIKSAIGKITDAFKSGLNKAKAVIEGHSPPITGPFKDIDIWGYNVGSAWVEGVRKAISTLSLNNPMSSPLVGSTVAPAVANSQGGSVRQGSLVNVEQMIVRDESDITDISRELGFRIETSSGYTQ